MNLFLKFIVLIIVMSFSTSIANENFFNEAKILYEEEKYDESKFLFQSCLLISFNFTYYKIFKSLYLF